MAQVWLRRCQECYHIQEDREPDKGKELPRAYTNRKCRNCKSEALDYGSWREAEDE